MVTNPMFRSRSLFFQSSSFLSYRSSVRLSGLPFTLSPSCAFSSQVPSIFALYKDRLYEEYNLGKETYSQSISESELPILLSDIENQSFLFSPIIAVEHGSSLGEAFPSDLIQSSVLLDMPSSDGGKISKRYDLYVLPKDPLVLNALGFLLAKLIMKGNPNKYNSFTLSHHWESFLKEKVCSLPLNVETFYHCQFYHTPQSKEKIQKLISSFLNDDSLSSLTRSFLENRIYNESSSEITSYFINDLPLVSLLPEALSEFYLLFLDRHLCEQEKGNEWVFHRHGSHYFFYFMKKRSMDDPTFPQFIHDLFASVGVSGKMSTAQNNENPISCFHFNQEYQILLQEGSMKVKKIESN